MSTTSGLRNEAAWQLAECGAYAADVPLWERLAAERPGPILELGAGIGRISLRLAAAGHELIALDSDPGLLAALESEAARRGLEVATVEGDASGPYPIGEIGLIIAPMQLVHLLAGPEQRRAMWDSARAALAPAGAFVAVLLDDSAPLGSGRPDPIPDVRELDGWIYSSLPLAVSTGRSGLVIERLRQLVSPAGELHEEQHRIELAAVGVAELADEAAACGLEPVERIEIAPTSEHVGSVALVLEARG